MMKRALLVIAKRPQPGRTKTRLTPPLSAHQASQLYECFLRDSLDLARSVAEVRHLVLYAPPSQGAYFSALAPDFDLLAQKGADLGQRLDNALTYCLMHGYEQVVVMNSDGPTLPVAYLAQAFAHLANADAVFGPSEDGGYYLVGLTGPQPQLLHEVKMSTPTVLQDTLALAKEEGVRVSLLPSWYDIDTISDLRRLLAETGSLPDGMAVHTRAYLPQLERQISLTDLNMAPINN
jgi:rSAM/selenodomain-associated transferase 1